MEKRLYCRIPPRRICIKYVLKEDVSELEVLRRSLTSMCDTDSILAMMLKNQAIIFQHKDSEDEWCDVTDSDVIENKSEIKVQLIPMTVPSDIVSSITTSVSAGFVNTENLKPGEILDVNVNVLYAEPGIPGSSKTDEQLLSTQNVDESSRSEAVVHTVST